MFGLYGPRLTDGAARRPGSGSGSRRLGSQADFRFFLKEHDGDGDDQAHADNQSQLGIIGHVQGLQGAEVRL
jgi:hypothetical protein